MPQIPWKPDLVLGAGYDEVRGEPKQRAVIGTLGKETQQGQIGDFDLLTVTTEDDFNSALGIDVSVSGSTGLFEASAKFSMKKRCKVSSQATFFVIRLVSTNAYERLDDPRLSPDAQELLENQNFDRFRERFGDVFVGGQFSGVEFYGVVRIEAEQVERQLDIASSLSASYGLALKGEANVNFSEGQSSKNSRLEISVYQKGGRIEPVQSLEALTGLAKNVVNDGRNGLAYPFTVSVDPYNELKLPNDNASFVEVQAARRNLRRMAEAQQSLQTMQNDIDFVLRNQAWFEVDAAVIDELNATNSLISEELKVIVDQADICSRNFERCEEFSPKIPQLKIPHRKAGMIEPPQAPPAPPLTKKDPSAPRILQTVKEASSWGGLDRGRGF